MGVGMGGGGCFVSLGRINLGSRLFNSGSCGFNFVSREVLRSLYALWKQDRGARWLEGFFLSFPSSFFFVTNYYQRARNT